jgi:hypothetical protein
VKPADELYVWISTDAAGEDGSMSVVEKNSGFEGTLASTSILVAVAWKPMIDKIAGVTGYKCRLVRYERREDVTDEFMEQSIALALADGAEKAPH